MGIAPFHLGSIYKRIDSLYHYLESMDMEVFGLYGGTKGML
jgi:hypothetical protein